MSHPQNDAAQAQVNPVKLVVWVFVGLIALVVGILMLAYYSVGGHTMGAKNEKANSAAEVEKRIAPVVSLEVDPAKAPAGGLVPAAMPKPSAAPAAIVAAVIPVALAAGATAAKPAGGEGVYQSSCGSCHGAGIAGAPKTGDKAVWGTRIAQGKATLYDHAIKGYQGKAGVMPAKGGNSALADADVKSAVDYMVAAAK